MEDGLQKVYGEHRFEEHDMKFGQDLGASTGFAEESDLVQETGAAGQMSRQEEENAFTYEVCAPTCEVYCSEQYEFNLVITIAQYPVCFAYDSYIWSSVLLIQLLHSEIPKVLFECWWDKILSSVFMS